MTAPLRTPAWACLAAACLLMLGGCAQGINVGVRGGSASDVEWRIGLPF